MNNQLVYVAETWPYKDTEELAHYYDGLNIAVRYYDSHSPVDRWEQGKDATLLVIAREGLAKEQFNKMPNLRGVVKWGRGVDRIDLPEATRRNILVAYTPYVVRGVAESALLLMMALAKNLVPQITAAKKGSWNKNVSQNNELYGKTLGIIGFGAVGKNLAEMATGLGMAVVVFTFPPQNHQDLGYNFVSLDDLLSRSEFISLHASALQGDPPILNAERISKIKDGCFVINTARGSLIDEEALIEALRSGKLGGAGLDVTAMEPISPDSPLLTMENVIVTPHALGQTKESMNQVKHGIQKSLRDMLCSNIPEYVANYDVLAMGKPIGLE